VVANAPSIIPLSANGLTLAMLLPRPGTLHRVRGRRADGAIFDAVYYAGETDFDMNGKRLRPRSRLQHGHDPAELELGHHGNSE